MKISNNLSFDYTELLVVAVNFLNIAPSEFWRLTPGEFTALVNHKLKTQGASSSDDYITKDEIRELKNIHPDGKVYVFSDKKQLKKDAINGYRG